MTSRRTEEGFALAGGGDLAQPPKLFGHADLRI
jgi:hypothetical protein